MRGTRRVLTIGLCALVLVPLVGIEVLTTTAAGAGITFYTDGVSSPYGITKGPDNALWFTDQGTNAIGRITTAGDVTEYTDPNSTISSPYDITKGPDNALWFTNWGNGSIGRIDPTSHVITNYPDSTVSEPYGITAGSDGALWFTNVGNNSIGRIDPTSHVITNYTDSINNTIASPYEIAAGSDGALWFANYSGDSIGRITTAGAVTAYTVPDSAYPYAITAGPDGALWFTNFYDNSIGRVTTDGAFTKYPVPYDNYYGYGGYDITSGPDGALWFTTYYGGSGYDTVGRISTTGAVTVYDTPNNYNYALGIAAGPDGALWFSDYNAIGRITTDTPGSCGAACTDVVAKQGAQVESSSGPPTDARPTKQTLTLPVQAGAGAVRVRFQSLNPGPSTSTPDKQLCPITGTSKCSGQISVIAGSFKKYVSRANPIRVRVLSKWKNGIPPGRLMMIKDNGEPPIHLAACVRSNGLYNTPCALPETVTGTAAQHNQITTDTVLFVGNDPHLGRRQSNLPDAPVAVKATAGRRQATVRWTKPTVTSGALTGYVITPHRGRTTLTPVSVGPAATSAIIKKLVTGTAYTFTVAAKNAHGLSYQSLPSKAVTPT